MIHAAHDAFAAIATPAGGPGCKASPPSRLLSPRRRAPGPALRRRPPSRWADPQPCLFRHFPVFPCSGFIPD
ncbi:hypothetical protein ACU4GD_12635 [Cupriavidus basilensis]